LAESDQKTLKLGIHSHGRRQQLVGGGAVPPPAWIFIHGTDIVDRGLIVLFSVFFANFWPFFRCPPSPGKFFPDALAYRFPAWRSAFERVSVERGTQVRLMYPWARQLTELLLHEYLPKARGGMCPGRRP